MLVRSIASNAVPRLVRLRVEKTPAATRLDDDDGDRVRDDVVQLARDPPPLLCDRRECALLLDTLERVGALLEGMLSSSAECHHSADHPRHAKQHSEEDDCANVE